MKIGIDLDDVLGDMVPVFVDYHNTIYGTALTKDNVWSYNFWDVLHISKEEAIKRVYEFQRSSRMMDIVPLDQSQHIVDMLRKDNELHIITARDNEFAPVTRRWLDVHFPNMFEDVHFTSHYSSQAPSETKGDVCKRVGAKVMIDDSFDNAVSCHRVCEGGVLLFDAPWNVNKQLLDRMHRVSSWHQVLEKLS